MIIDAHCHLGKGRYKSLEPKSLVSSMDRNGIDKSVIVPVEEFISVYNEEGNEYILETVKEYGDRFIGFATINPWYGAKGMDMLRRFLEKGLKGIKLNPSLQGFLLNDELVFDVVKAAEEYDIPVYFHTGTPVHSLPFQLRDLAVNFPNVNFIMGHMGAYDFGSDIIQASKGLNNIYLETSLNLSRAIGRAISEVGTERVLFGSDSPRSEQDFELEKVREACKELECFDKVAGANIISLLGVKI